MDWSKIIDKFFGFLCNLIPGAAVLLVGALHRPEVWAALWKPGYLGYQTKLTVLITAAFIAGSTVNSALGAISSMVMTKLSALQAKQPAAKPQQPFPYWQ